jgi:hypothetical protein
VRTARWRWLGVTLGIGLFMQAALLAGDAYADRITVPALGRKADLYQRTLGWRGLGEQAARLARMAGAPTVAAEGRGEVAALIYYLRNEPVRALSWPVSVTPQHQFDLTRALSGSEAEPVLFISRCPIASRLGVFYREVTPLGAFSVSSGPSSMRQYHAFKLAKRRRPIGPLGPCAEAAQR